MHTSFARFSAKLLACALIAALLLSGCALADGGRITNKTGFKRTTATPSPEIAPSPVPEITPSPAPVSTPQPSPTPYVEKPVLPDPGYTLHTLATLVQENVTYDGIVYNVYQYDYNVDANSLSLVGHYDWVVRAKGFDWKPLHDLTEYGSGYEAPNIYWYAISKDGATAYLRTSNVIWRSATTLLLYVPETIQFTPESEVQPTKSPYDSGFYNTLPPGWNDTVYISSDPSSPTVCFYCHGTKTCPNCHGSGYYRNPYTGSQLKCSCGNGRCPTCD